MTSLPGSRTVWLASYPKSGNTWVRSFVTALGVHTHLFGVDHLAAGAQPYHVGMALGAYGIDARWLDDDELDRLRDGLIRLLDGADDTASGNAPLMRKTHERYRTGEPGREPFPTDVTRAAVLVVRDPRDVACSYAPFFGMTIDQAIDAMGKESGTLRANAARMQTAQPWGSWSDNVLSWLAEDVPFPVHLVRYEDLQVDALACLEPILTSVGLDCTPEELAAAVDRATFTRLQASETERGFRGTSAKTTTFFRRGVHGGWRDELTPEQVTRIETAHGDVMALLGYDLESVPPEAAPADWLALPGVLGLTTREGVLPDELPDAERPRPWLQANATSALVRFRGGAGVLVDNGTDVTVARGHAAADEVGWMVQGWAVTLAMLQRGLLSLHATTVLVGDQVVAIAGGRGAGKSTTALALHARGHRLLCDDVTVVEFREDGAWTTPYWRNVHLLADSATALGVDFASLPSLGRGRVKAAYRPEAPDEVPRRIDRIVVLAPSDAASDVTSDAPSGAARLASLVEHTDRDGIAPVILGPGRYFAQVARLADLVPITVVSRPSDAWTIDAVLDAIEDAAHD